MDNSIQNQFLKDIAEHRMETLHEQGLYRHIKFSRAGSNCYRFDLITWPGHLTITGDVGTYTFSRTRDMFDFFRSADLGINPGYWQEKLQAGASTPDRRLTMEWDEEAFGQAVIRRYKEWLESQGEIPSPEKGELIRFEIKNEVLRHAEFEESACMAVQSFDDSDCPGLFDDFLEHAAYCHSYQSHYLWCCYAIVWGIQQYDKETRHD